MSLKRISHSNSIIRDLIRTGRVLPREWAKWNKIDHKSKKETLKSSTNYSVLNKHSLCVSWYNSIEKQNNVLMKTPSLKSPYTSLSLCYNSLSTNWANKMKNNLNISCFSSNLIFYFRSKIYWKFSLISLILKNSAHSSETKYFLLSIFRESI